MSYFTAGLYYAVLCCVPVISVVGKVETNASTSLLRAQNKVKQEVHDGRKKEKSDGGYYVTSPTKVGLPNY